MVSIMNQSRAAYSGVRATFQQTAKSTTPPAGAPRRKQQTLRAFFGPSSGSAVRPESRGLQLQTFPTPSTSATPPSSTVSRTPGSSGVECRARGDHPGHDVDVPVGAKRNLFGSGCKDDAREAGSFRIPKRARLTRHGAEAERDNDGMSDGDVERSRFRLVKKACLDSGLFRQKRTARRIVVEDEDDDSDPRTAKGSDCIPAAHTDAHVKGGHVWQHPGELKGPEEQDGLRAVQAYARFAVPAMTANTGRPCSTGGSSSLSTAADLRPEAGILDEQFLVQAPKSLPGRHSQRSKLAAVDLSGGHVEESGGWCDKNPWSVRVNDSKQRSPDDPDYDPTTLFVPKDILERMSPFQKQFWELKKEHYNTMLFVKKGAFMEAYDIDADIVHRELGLNYTSGGRASMRCAGVPESALNRHAARLIDLGYRVGVVMQTETANAADKRKMASGYVSGTSKVCQRTLVRILTRATVTDDDLLRDHRPRFVMAIREADRNAIDQVGANVVGVCFVDVASGRITVGEYQDDNRRSWTEKLLSTLKPPEVIVPERSLLTNRMRELMRWTTTGAWHVDIMHRNATSFKAMTLDWFNMYVGGHDSKHVPHNNAIEKLLRPEYFEQHPLAALAFGAIATYLAELLIDKETLSVGNYTVLPEIKAEDSGIHSVHGGDRSEHVERAQFSNEHSPSYDPTRASRGGLSMDAATMANLEVLANVMDGSERGAIISVIDRASTPAGRRLLRRWIVDPLVCSEEINDRLNAVDAILSVDSTDLGQVRKQLMSGPDLERALPRLHQFAVVADIAVMFDDTNARRVKEFVKVLRGLKTTMAALEQLRSSMSDEAFRPARRLAWILRRDGAIQSNASEELEFFFGTAFDVERAEAHGEVLPEAEVSPLFDRAKARLDDVEVKLEVELQEWKDRLGDSSITFYHRGKEPYQLRIPSETVKRSRQVPSAFIPTGEAKGFKHYYTENIQALVKLHVDASEAFSDASMNVLRDIVLRFDEKRDVWNSVVKVAAEVDALIGLAIASMGDGSAPMVRPEVLPDDYPEPVFEVKELRHPVLAAKAGSSFVSNDTVLGGDCSDRIAVITGSNCSGKSTLSRQVAVSVILSQVGAYVPAKSLRLRPFSALFARAGSRDEIARGRSTFMVEMEEAALIINTVTDRSLVIVDELASGTTAQDAHAISHAALNHLLGVGCLSIFCTHIDALANEFAGRVGNYMMAADVDADNKNICFLYKLVRGVTNHSRGVCCARVAGIPSDVADYAGAISKEYDWARTSAQRVSRFLCLVKALGDMTSEANRSSALGLLRSLSSNSSH